jgi:hypothetical protein
MKIKKAQTAHLASVQHEHELPTAHLLHKRPLHPTPFSSSSIELHCTSLATKQRNFPAHSCTDVIKFFTPVHVFFFFFN